MTCYVHLLRRLSSIPTCCSYSSVSNILFRLELPVSLVLKNRTPTKKQPQSPPKWLAKKCPCRSKSAGQGPNKHDFAGIYPCYSSSQLCLRVKQWLSNQPVSMGNFLITNDEGVYIILNLYYLRSSNTIGV